MTAVIARGVSIGQGPLLVGAVTTLAAIALWPSVNWLLRNWREIHDYRHGYLIAAVSIVWLYLAVRNRATVRPAFSASGTALLALCLFAWLVAYRANSIMAFQLLLVPAMWLAIVAVGGWQFARPALAPIAYLFFAMPVWEYLLPLLQWLSVLVTETTLSIAGVPAEVTDYTVKIPSGTFEIVEGCSGKRYFIVTLAFAVVAGVLQRLRSSQMAALVVTAGLLALIANWLRIVVVILSGHITDMQHYLVAREHESFGNVVFVLLLASVYVLSRRWSAMAVNKGMIEAGHDATVQGSTGPLTQGIPFLLLLATLGVTHLAGAETGLGVRHPDGLPFVAGEWAGPLPAAAVWLPRYVQPGFEKRAAYQNRYGRTVEIYVNLYEEQHPGRELIFHANTLLAPGSWTRSWPMKTGRIETDSAPALASLAARSPSGEAWQLAYVYKIGRWETTNSGLAQAAYGLQSVLRPTPAGVIALGVQCRDNCQEAQELVRTFWRDLSGPILQSIPDHEG